MLLDGLKGGSMNFDRGGAQSCNVDVVLFITFVPLDLLITIFFGGPGGVRPLNPTP